MSISPFKSVDTNAQVLLYKITNADMQSTSDQLMTKTAAFTECMPFHVVAAPKTGKVTIACQGGIYDTAGKTGTAIVTSSTTWFVDSTTTPKIGIKLSGAGGGVGGQVNTSNSIITTSTAYFSITAGSTGACTADIYVYGYIVS